MYTPRSSGFTRTEMENGSAATSSGRPMWYATPAASRTRIVDSAASGRSENDSRTNVGEAPSVAPSAECQARGPAWASRVR